VSRLRGMLSRALALFVDDWPTTVAILAWLLVFAAAMPRLPQAAAGPLLACGLAIILVASVAARARR